jgi:WD40 repeat protein
MKPTRERMISVLPLLLLGVAGHASTVMAQFTGTLTATGNMNTARTAHTATLLPNGKVLIAGGLQFFPPPVYDVILASAELYDPSTGTFTPTGSMITARGGHTATLLPDGKVLIAGGRRDGPASAELYDPSTGAFTATGDMTTTGGAATLLNNGKVLITGSTAELYDPATGTFAPTGAYAAIRGGDPATLLANGKVLVGSCDARTELYDPGAGTFSLTGSLTAGPLRGYRCSFSATLLPDGKVLIAGGDNDFFYPSTAEVYDPSTGTFTVTGSMATGREHHTATLLPDGTVLIAGGGDGYATASTEIYNPVTGMFSAKGNMTTARDGHTATLLPDGTVLMTGTSPGSSSAELYSPPLLQPAPLLLSLSGDGRGQGAILHAGSHQVVSSSNPAVVGEALEVYCTGLIDGSVIPPQVTVGARMAEILFFGNAPGFAGLNQVNVRVPSVVAPGPAVPVRLTYLGRPSNEVTIGVR